MYIQDVRDICQYAMQNKIKLVMTSLKYLQLIEPNNALNNEIHKLNKKVHATVSKFTNIVYFELNTYQRNCFVRNKTLSNVGKKLLISDIKMINFSVMSSKLVVLTGMNDSENKESCCDFLEKGKNPNLTMQ